MPPAAAFEMQRHFLATVTPSGNSIVERATLALLRDFPSVSPHFSRTPVFGASDPYPDAYDWTHMLRAAELLGHTRPGIVVWNGSKGGFVGMAVERELRARLEATAKCPSTTSLFAMVEALELLGATRLAFVTPYADAYQAKIETNFAALGFATVARENACLADNLSYARVPLDGIRTMARRAAAAKPDAILGWCTNYPSAWIAAEIEAETGIPFLDATTIVLWQALKMLGLDPAPAAANWGRIFAQNGASAATRTFQSGAARDQSTL